MHRRHLAPLLLAAAALLLPGCGSRSHLIPQTDAATLSGNLRQIDSLLLKRRCDELPAAIAAARQTAVSLPASVDRPLRDRIVAGLDRLAKQAPIDCAGATTTTKTTDTTTVTTETQTTATDTTPVTTTPTETTPAPTPTETTPAPTPTQTTPAPAPAPTPTTRAAAPAAEEVPGTVAEPVATGPAATAVAQAPEERRHDHDRGALRARRTARPRRDVDGPRRLRPPARTRGRDQAAGRPPGR